RKSHANRSAPILHHQSHIPEFELLDEFSDDETLLARRIAKRAWSRGKAESRIIQRDATERAPQTAHQLPPLKRPRRVTVQEQKGFATSHINVMDSRAARKVDEPLLRIEYRLRNFEVRSAGGSNQRKLRCETGGNTEKLDHTQSRHHSK